MGWSWEEAGDTEEESSGPEHQNTPFDAGTRHHTDDTERHVMEFEGREYEVYEAYPDYDGGRVHELPRGAMIVEYATDPEHCYFLVDTDGDGKPNMVTWDPTNAMFKKWVDAGQVSPKLIPNNLGQDFARENPDAVMNSYDYAADPTKPTISGEREGGTFGTERVVYDHDAMNRFCTEVGEAAAAFERRCGGLNRLANVVVQPGQTPQAEKMREQFNLPAGRIADYFDEHLHQVPKNLQAMCDGVRSASTRVQDRDNEMAIDAKELEAAMDRGAGAGNATTDVSYDDI